jgi:hypothetical protein
MIPYTKRQICAANESRKVLLSSYLLHVLFDFVGPSVSSFSHVWCAFKEWNCQIDM